MVRVLLVLLFLTAAAGNIGWFLSPPSLQTSSPHANRKPIDEKRDGRLQSIIARQAIAQANPWDEGTFDTNADRVYGQPDFTTNEQVYNPPSSTGMYQPEGIATLWTGHIVVADSANNRVLGWNNLEAFENGDPADFVIGQPNFTSSTVPNPPTNASLNQPTGVTFDFDGNLYVADTGNHRVLIYQPPIDANDYPLFTSGMKATIVIGQNDFTGSVASNPPTNSTLNHPTGVAIDSNYNLVVADRDNNRVLIYSWPHETGMAATYVVGQYTDASARYGDFTSNKRASFAEPTTLNHPTGVAIGMASDELYIADTGNHRILVFAKTNPLNGIADYVIGQPNFTSNTSNNGGVSATSLYSPTGLIVDGYNRLYVADTGNNRVLFYSNPLAANPTATAIFGQGDVLTTGMPNKGGISKKSLKAPVGVATDFYTMGVFIVDQGNNRMLGYHRPQNNAAPIIKELDPGTVRVGRGDFKLEVYGAGIGPGTTAQVNGVTKATNKDYLGGMDVPIAAKDFATGNVTITLTSPPPGGGVSNVAMLAVYQPQEGDTSADGVFGQSGFNTQNAGFIPIAANTLYYPSSVAIDQRTGRLFVSDTRNNRVLSWSTLQTSDGAQADLVIGQTDFTSDEWCILNEQDLYPNEEPCSRGSSGLSFNQGVAIDKNGNLYVADSGNNRVLIFKIPLSNGKAASMVIGQPDFTKGTAPDQATASSVFTPLDVAVDEATNLYVADFANNRVLIYQSPLSNGMQATKVIGQPDFTQTKANNGGVSASSLYGPIGVEVDSAGNLYVTDQGNHRVFVYNSPLTSDVIADRVFGQQGSFTTNTPNKGGISGSSLNMPGDATIDPNGNLYIVDSGNNRVLLYTQPLMNTNADQIFGQTAMSSLHAIATPDSTIFHAPVGVAVDASGNVAIADQNNSRVLIYNKPILPSALVEKKLYLPIIQR